MTIYVHFHIATGKAAVRLHNVTRVEDNGPDSVKVKNTFTDETKVFVNVSHVALKPDTE
jgi:hypothetical protein